MTVHDKDGTPPPSRERPLCAILVEEQTVSADLWFSDDPGEQQEAADTCMDCPFRQQCFLSAIKNKEDYGIWGGVLFPVRKRKGSQ